MQPTVTILVPQIDPPNTFRASKVSDMFEVQMPRNESYTYTIGEPLQNGRFDIDFKNLTINTPLQVNIKFPPFVTIENTLGEFQMVAPVDKTIPLRCTIIEDVLKEHSIRTTQDWVELIVITVTPSVTAGPVFVKK